MKFSKIILSLLLVLAMVLPVFAVDAHPGETVSATITFTSAEAYSFGVAFELPSDLKLISSSTSDGNVGPSKWGAFGNSVITNATCTFVFEIPSSASVGDTYEIKATLEEASDRLGNSVSATVSNATIKIVGDSIEHEHVWDEGKVTKEATCVASGVKTYTCSVCGETKTEKIPATGNHTWDAGKVTKEATCVASGVKTYTCTICGETKTEEIPATGKHTWDSGKQTKDPTCVDNGVLTYTCKVCGETKTEVIPATGIHSWDEGKVTTKPTDTKPGVKIYTCIVCGETKIEEIAPTGDHTWDEGKVTKEPTCGTPGVMTFTCKSCGATYTKEIPATGKHTWDDGKLTVEATCTKSGIKIYTCKVCGDTKKVVVPELGHTLVLKNDKDATWDSVGYTGDWVCVVCGEIIEKGHEIPALGNDDILLGIMMYRNRNLPSKVKAPEEDSLPFIDVSKTDVFYDDIKYVYEKGIMNGISETEFAPNSTLTRAMIVTVLYRAEGEPVTTFVGAFNDVQEGLWYSDAIEWAAANGIVNGYGDGKFGPNDDVTREQLAAILYRYANKKGYDVSIGKDTNILSYDDAFDISDWAVAAMQWACGTDVLNSGETAAIRPIEAATRAEIAHAIHAFLVNVAK